MAYYFALCSELGKIDRSVRRASCWSALGREFEKHAKGDEGVVGLHRRFGETVDNPVDLGVRDVGKLETEYGLQVTIEDAAILGNRRRLVVLWRAANLEK